MIFYLPHRNIVWIALCFLCSYVVNLEKTKILNMESLGDRKLQLIQKIMSLQNEHSISKMERELVSIVELEKNIKIQSVVKPIRKKITIEEMIKEQDYKPIKKQDFYDKVARLNIEESLEELLSMLRR